MTELQDALEVNGKAIASDQQEYHEMMKKSFTGMLERLKDFFGNQDVSLLFKYMYLIIAFSLFSNIRMFWKTVMTQLMS